jgi:hypothetical protein
MAVTYPDGVKEVRLRAVRDKIDAGAAAGKLVLQASGGTAIVTVTLADPCGTAVNNVLTFDFDPDISGTATSTAVLALACLTDDSNTTAVSGLTVGTSGADVIVQNTSVNTGQVVTIQTGTITHA